MQHHEVMLPNALQACKHHHAIAHQPQRTYDIACAMQYMCQLTSPCMPLRANAPLFAAMKPPGKQGNTVQHEVPDPVLWTTYMFGPVNREQSRFVHENDARWLPRKPTSLLETQHANRNVSGPSYLGAKKETRSWHATIYNMPNTSSSGLAQCILRTHNPVSLQSRTGRPSRPKIKTGVCRRRPHALRECAWAWQSAANDRTADVHRILVNLSPCFSRLLRRAASSALHMDTERT